MHVRIRYSKSEIPTTLASVRVFANGSKQYRVFLHVDRNEFEIVELGENTVYVAGQADSLPALKIRAKEELTALLPDLFKKETRGLTAAQL